MFDKKPEETPDEKSTSEAVRKHAEERSDPPPSDEQVQRACVLAQPKEASKRGVDTAVERERKGLRPNPLRKTRAEVDVS